MADFMAEALKEAEEAGKRDEIPVGAVLVLDGKIIAQAGNRTRELNDVTAHAEILVIREAAHRLGNERLNAADLYVTLEPCPMCAAAISFARIRRLYFGTEDQKSGAVDNGVRLFNDKSCHHVPEVYSGIAETQSRLLLTEFFKNKRT